MARNEKNGCIAVVLGGLGGLGLAALIGTFVRDAERKADRVINDLAEHTGGDTQHQSTKSVAVSRDICLVKVHVNVSVHVDPANPAHSKKLRRTAKG